MRFPPPPPPAEPPRVVVTGAGIVTALGVGWQANAEGFRAGRTAFRPVTLFDVSRHRVKTAAQVDLPSALPPTQLGARQLARLDRAGALLLLAAGGSVAAGRLGTHGRIARRSGHHLGRHVAR